MFNRVIHSLLLLSTLTPILGCSSPLLVVKTDTRLALSPTSRLDKTWWKQRHQEKLNGVTQQKDQIQLLFLGDSITQGWESKGKAVWEAYYGQRQAFNLGYSGDRTEHVLWRLQNGEVEGLSPRVVVLMIGTNNTGHRLEQPSDTVAGTSAILKELRHRLPKSKILLLAVFPRGANTTDAKRLQNDAINQALPDLADNQHIFHLNINPIFLETDGRLPRNIMPDVLHPNARGYQLWALAMDKTLAQLLGEQPYTNTPQDIPLWPHAIPGIVTEKSETILPNYAPTDRHIAHVSVPTLAFFPAPKSRKARPAVLVCPGGGYERLAYDKEGVDAATWLNRDGINAAILKYRVPQNRDGAFQDAQRALGLLRHQADTLKIDPNRIGVLGFSAGGHLSARLSTNYQERRYPTVDAADQVSCRPDFTVLVYPAYLGQEDGSLIPEIPVDPQTPPAFIVQTEDDKKYVSSSLAYYQALAQQEISAELHLYPTGGHGYGLQPSAYPVSRWPEVCEIWLSRLQD